MSFSYGEASALILKALLEDDPRITALDGWRFKTTRITNHICGLRDDGLKIETEMLKVDSGKRYGRYKLIQSDVNIKRAIELLEQIESRLHVEGAS
ncbi:MAG: helix-turn-helix domain-containing protein [Campylobacterota bacterium]|nr:helix-turn-helix domain-containing protein [Campylobacterota bacterium]